MSFGAPPCASPAEPGWRRTLSSSERIARERALELAVRSNATAADLVSMAEAFRAFLMGETK